MGRRDKKLEKQREQRNRASHPPIFPDPAHETPVAAPAAQHS
jgi:hypothetical protein